MSATSQYAVLLRSDVRPAADQIRCAFSSFSHLTDADAVRLAANAEGILMRQLSSDEARAFHRALNAEGVDAVVVAEDNLTALPKKMALQRIELTETDFVVFDQIGRPEKFPWSRILLLALGAMTHVGFARTTAVETKPGYNPVTRLWPKETVEHSHKLAKDSQLLIEIVLDSSGKRFQINAAEFPFRYVVDRPEFSLLDKTVWLAGELIRRAPHALLNRGARDVRDGVKLVRGYPTPQVFNDEMVWLLWDQAQKNITR
jgi:hypothetical protein